MKLLLDESLPPSLARAVGETFPASSHVLYLGFAQATDADLYRFAGDNGFAIVTRNDDFEFLSHLLGPPPRIVVLAVGNATVAELRALLERHGAVIAEFIRSADEDRVLKICSDT